MGERVALWGEHFQGASAEALATLFVSTRFDWRLADYDLQGSLAHAKALHEAKLLTDNEYLALTAALEHLRQDVTSGAFTYSPEDKDVHTALERGLLEDRYAGEELGRKLRAGRSRGDQIAALIRMHLHDAASRLDKQLMSLTHTLINQAGAAENHLIPGCTYMQHVQPVLVARQLVAHRWPQIRNLKHLTDWRKHSDASPYGGGALAGNILGPDPELVVRELGFTNACQNSVDGAAPRDGMAEFLYILTRIAVDMSHLAEEIIIWNTAEFDYVTLDDAYSTRSSIIPQKKNPDVAELVHNKARHLIGNLTGLLTILKGLLLAYDRDLQEDGELVFGAIDTLEVLLPAMTGMARTIRLHYNQMEALPTAGSSLAISMAEWLVKQGMPFRRAHRVSGACVALTKSRRCGLEGLSDADSVGVNPALTLEVRGMLSASSAVSAQRGAESTTPMRVAERISAARMRLEWLDA